MFATKRKTTGKNGFYVGLDYRFSRGCSDSRQHHNQKQDRLTCFSAELDDCSEWQGLDTCSWVS